MSNLIGQSLGRYHILEQLGEGGMATVYKAFDTRLERDVAVKIIRRAAFPPEQLDRILKRFEREAKALAKLSHPNIVGVIDYGDYEGSPYFVMEFLPSGTLKQQLGKPIPWREAARLLLPVARALQYAHKQGIVHRDIKPSNILITESGEPMLADFGIAKILESGEAATLTGTGIGMGTPEYMAPEQWTGNVTAQSDIYSLGVVFYEMVTGRKPYAADTPAAVLLKQASEPLPRPSKFVTGLPEEVERVLLKALAKKPDDRHPDMAAFTVSLERLLVGESKREKPIHITQVISRKGKSTAHTHAEAKDVQKQTDTKYSLGDNPAKTTLKPQALYFSTPAKRIANPPQESFKRNRLLFISGIAFLLCLILGVGFAAMSAKGRGLFSAFHAFTPTRTPTSLSTNTPTPIILPTRTTQSTATLNLDSGLLSSDWPTAGHDAQLSGFNSQETLLSPPLRLLWSKSLGNYYIDRITVLKGKLAVSGMGEGDLNQIIMLDANTGNSLWDFILPNGGTGAMSIAPAQNNSSVFFGGQHDNSIYSLDRDTGVTNWQFDGISEFWGSNLTILDDFLLVPDTTTGIAALNPHTGRLIWGSTSGGVLLSVAVNKDKVFGVRNGNTLIAKKILTGDDLWSIGGLQSIFTRITTEGQNVFFNSSDNEVVCANTTNGDVNWKVVISGKILRGIRFASAFNMLFIPVSSDQDINGEIMALDITTGNILWSFDTKAGGASAISIANRKVYISLWSSSIIYALDVETGELSWSYSMDSYGMDAVIANHTLYAASMHTIYAFSN
jgi:serine/threonine protein kinase